MKYDKRLRQLRVALPVLLLCVVSSPLIAQEDSESPIRMQARELVEEGMALSDGSKREEELYLEARDLDPSYYRPLFNLGLVYSDRRSYPLALTYFERFAQFEPESAAGLYQLAATYDNLRVDQDAADYYTRYLQAATAQTDFSDQERQFIESAANAIKRLMNSDTARVASGGAGRTETISRSEQISTIMETHNDANVDDIVEILARPRIRGVNFKLESAPVYGNSDIRFEKSSATFLPESYDALDKIAGALMHEKLSKHIFIIHGHASTEGATGFNESLSQKRAMAVMKYLTDEYTIASERLDVHPWGESNPLVAPEKSEQDRIHNRRVEFENSRVLVTTVSGKGEKPQ